MTVFVNRAWMSTATSGTGTITLGSALSGYQTFADAGVADTNVVRYTIIDGANWEIGLGTYTSSGTTMTRSVSESSNADAAVNLSGSATVFLTAAAADINFREKLTANRTYYIRSDGSDSNTGLVDSAGGAFATFAALWTLVTGTLDFGGKTVTIKIGGTTQTITNGFNITQPWTGGGSLILDGGSGTINPTGASCLQVTSPLPGTVTLQNMTLTATTSGDCVTMEAPGTVVIGTGVIYGAVSVSNRHLSANVPGAIIDETGASPTITGGGQMHILTTSGGLVKEVGATITVTGRIVFTYYVYTDRSGLVTANGTTWKGSATITMSIASPAVVTWASHGLSIGDPVVFNTTGALPTGVTAGTTYFVIAAGFGAGSFQFSTTSGGAAVNTSGSQSGTHNAYSLTAQRYNVSGLSNLFTSGASINYLPGSTAGVGTNPGASPYGYYN